MQEDDNCSMAGSSKRRDLLLLLGILACIVQPRHSIATPAPARIASASVVKTIGPGSTGSGVLIEVPRKNGIGMRSVIVTAAHVLKGTGSEETIEFRFYDDTIIESKGADIVYLDEVDLAFVELRIDANRRNNYIFAKVGNSNILSHGDHVVVSGYPLESTENVSNSVRISEGIMQTLSSLDAAKALAGYSANTRPGMSGGGVFNDEGQLVFIHLKGEKDNLSSLRSVGVDSVKSGTNYGVSVLHAINRMRDLELKDVMPMGPLTRFQKGLYFVQSNKPKEAYEIFLQLYREFPDSLVAEWSTKCMQAQVLYPHGQPTQWPEGELSQDAFVKRHGVKPAYWWPYFSDSHIWDGKERKILLGYDPIYKLASPMGEWSMGNRGGMVEVNTHGHCERIPGLSSYVGASGRKILHWEMIYNPSGFANDRQFEFDLRTKTFRLIESR